MASFSSAVAWTYDTVVRYALKFGVVGLIGWVVDVGVFNLLRTDALGTAGVITGPIGAKVVSVSVAIIVTWVGNRYWTFRHLRRRRVVLEFVEFTAVALVGMGVSLLCLWISHYVLGFTSLLADNISANVIGLGLGTILRFVLYRLWVFGHHRSDGLQHAAPTPSTASEPLAVTTEPA